MSASMPTFRPVLNFWRDVEFFIPFDLDDVRDAYFDRCFEINKQLSNPLPWEDAKFYKLSPEKEYAFDFYFAPFAKSEIVRLLTHKFPEISKELFTDPRELDGLSCYARISFNEQGRPLLDDTKISTLPWAIDSLLVDQPLSMSNFDMFTEMFLSNVEHEIEKLNQLKETDNQLNIPQLIIAHLYEHLTYDSQINFGPNNIIGYIIPQIIRKKKSANKNFFDSKKALSVNVKEVLGKKRKVEILNSFYLRDLEKAALYIAPQSAKHPKTSPLIKYLHAISEVTEKVDIFSDSAHKIIAHNCSAARLPSGRWLDASDKYLSLNQQIAINYYLDPKTTLCAVNGPPGTGKTTLVRDLVAAVVVERAKVLAQLKSPSAAFNPQFLRFDSAGDTILTRDLIPQLKGFEILVASSNNNAVENISKALPQQQSLGPDYMSLEYIKAVARLLTKLSVGQTNENDLSHIWGLVSVPLGNRKNRGRFRMAGFVGIPGESDEEKLARVKTGEFLTLEEWRKTFKPDSLSFNMAKRDFLNKLNELEEYSKTSNADEFAINADLQNKNMQIAAPGLNTNLNQLRSDLFASALVLHEAWVREVPRLEIELASLNKFLKSPQRHTAEVNTVLWSLLFMITPVISSTLASIEVMFGKLPPESLAHVIIDEAGQAVPQAALGSLLRAKKALIIGDQRQLDPICLLPKTLEQYLGNNLNSHQLFNASPLSSSVQSIADNQMSLGTFFSEGSQRTWVGIPLCVHRRCLEPMFSIANNIAYDGIMIAADDISPPAEGLLGGSAWFDVKGSVKKKQWVTEQGKLASSLLLELISQTDNKLPDVFFITPFRQVRAELRLVLARALKQAGHQHYIKAIRRRIGTVHTFQGKEAELVFLILGCDQTTALAADWAGAKPNLINVAVTRARKYLYVIGDLDLWHNKGYFSDLEKQLPKVIKKSV